MLGHNFRLCGILVIQIKPQLEKVLKLPEDGLTKESCLLCFFWLEKNTSNMNNFHCDWMVEKVWTLHPGRLTWTIMMEVWKIIFLSKWVICRFHVNLPGCKLDGATWPFWRIKLGCKMDHWWIDHCYPSLSTLPETNVTPESPGVGRCKKNLLERPPGRCELLVCRDGTVDGRNPAPPEMQKAL